MSNDHNQAERAAPCPLCHTDQVQICRDSNNPAKDSARCRECKCTGPLLIWNQRRSPAVGEDGLPPLPAPFDAVEMADGRTEHVYSAEQVRQAQREAVAADRAARETNSDLAPIEYDRDMDRTYIPLPAGWEIQTKGKGSTFRIAHAQQGTRWIVMDDRLHEPLEGLARDVRNALAAKDQEIADLRAQLALQSAPNVGTGDVTMSMCVSREDYDELTTGKPHTCGLSGEHFGVCPHCSAPQQASQQGENDVG
jgi:hypothetical protein